ncbi:smc domain-containing protein [Leptolyngbya sp. Heron Island J]|uniref:AAA family ATPase n=1 Tax=Leptolyngbya sp. Heron Island J TaxID=1385935 RepID=UPI0003B99765|nr:SMC family ATPase [Leptolyngbya sp. Heron Island J]ESA37529.1 smc domain-containing protein [Leptolyngbya sp. Heron Island J]
MYLLSVTLTNFKAHRDRNFEFQLGTNAICGVNGAGKTSILEAIAWTLFNHRGGYKQEDLVRNGSGSAQVRVAFVSSYDSRTYEVERCTSRGYTLYDPQLGERLNYSRIKDEVEPWLKQHLGVPVGTDLGQLFANTIGVPQGTFTADFLLSPEKRKPIFDNVLKVEEYRQVHKDSNALRRYAEAQVELVKNQLQQYEERLQSLDPLQARYESLLAEIAAGEQQLAHLQEGLAQLQTQKDALAVQAEKIQGLQQQQQQLSLQLEAKQQAQNVMKQAQHRAQQAQDLCQAHAAAYRCFLEIENTLKALTQKNKQRQQLVQQQLAQQRNLDQQAATLAGLQVKLEQHSRFQSQLESLAPQCQQQDRLESERQVLLEKQQALAKLQLRSQSLHERLARQQQDIQQAERELRALDVLEDTVKMIPDLEQQQQRWQQQLSRIAAAQQFEIELRQLVTHHRTQSASYAQQTVAAITALDELQQSLSLLSQDVVEQLKTAIATGQNLSQTTLSALESILTDLTEQVDTEQLNRNLKSGQIQLNKAYGDQAQLNNRARLQQKHTKLIGQQQQLQADIAELEQQLTQAEHLARRLSTVEKTIATLSDPKGRRHVLQEQIQTMVNVEADYERLQTHRQTLEASLAQLTEQIADFADLDQAITQQQQQRQEYQPGYLLYIQHEKDAQSLERLNTDVAAANQVVVDLTQQLTTLTSELQQLSADFDPATLQQLEQRYAEVKSQCDRITGSLPQQRKLQTELIGQLDSLRQIAAKQDQAQLDLKQKERVKRFINFARKAYKAAGPRITERYVHGISQEADRLFRELLNRPNVALEWTRDYEILVQEGGNTRRFINLSGGEQMCAALAVRLALLKVLADIDIAFFDEPTTNMDRPRRESLAEAIARLKAFKQLFVISHDDTFEKVTEHVIVVEREDELVDA